MQIVMVVVTRNQEISLVVPIERWCHPEIKSGKKIEREP